MADIWSHQSRFQRMLEVEKAVAAALGELKLIPLAAAQAIQKKAGFSLKNIHENEKTTRHDVTAFVQELASYVGEPHGSYVHWGLSSSDVLDTALALQIRQAFRVLDTSFAVLDGGIGEAGFGSCGYGVSCPHAWPGG